jgi:hypothetical protein
VSVVCGVVIVYLQAGPTPIAFKIRIEFNSVLKLFFDHVTLNANLLLSIYKLELHLLLLLLLSIYKLDLHLLRYKY